MTATRTRERVVRSQVDPRLVERRREVAEAGRARRRRRSIVGLVVAVLCAGVVAVAFSPLLDVDHIAVDGLEVGSLDAVLAAANVGPDDQMVQVDLAGARQGVRSLPWVRSATVTREWPSTVRIVVTEEEPAALLVVGGSTHVVSTTGRLLGADSAPEGLPELHLEQFEPVGEAPLREVSGEVLAAALMLHRAGDGFRAAFQSATLDADGSLSVAVDSGATIRFGRSDDLATKLVAAEAVLGQVESECWRFIDVREPTRVTVTRSCTAPATGGTDTEAEG